MNMEPDGDADMVFEALMSWPIIRMSNYVTEHSVPLLGHMVGKKENQPISKMQFTSEADIDFVVIKNNFDVILLQRTTSMQNDCDIFIRLTPSHN